MSGSLGPILSRQGRVIEPVRRLAEIKPSPSCVVYHDGPLQVDPAWRFQLFGHCRTGELFVELSDGANAYVCTFPSSVSDLTPAERREGIAWPDLAEAFSAARDLYRSTVGQLRWS